MELAGLHLSSMTLAGFHLSLILPMWKVLRPSVLWRVSAHLALVSTLAFPSAS
jgi:hypothetical protein